MTIRRTDDPENPFLALACKAAALFGAGSRNPSGPAAMLPRQQAGHMTAIDPPVKVLIPPLHSRGRPHMRGGEADAAIPTKPGAHNWIEIAASALPPRNDNG